MPIKLNIKPEVLEALRVAKEAKLAETIKEEKGVITVCGVKYALPTVWSLDIITLDLFADGKKIGKPVRCCYGLYYFDYEVLPVIPNPSADKLSLRVKWQYNPRHASNRDFHLWNSTKKETICNQLYNEGDTIEHIRSKVPDTLLQKINITVKLEQAHWPLKLYNERDRHFECDTHKKFHNRK
jgi:hypothetical protein